MQYKCVCSIITRRHAAALGMRGQPMPRLYMSADGEGRPDWAWMADFVWVLISRFREVWRLPAPRRREPRSEPPRFARRRRCARRTSRLSTSGPGSPRRQAGPAGRREPGTRAAGPGPSPASRHLPPRRAVRGAISFLRNPTSACLLLSMLMYGKEASNRKQEIDRQHYTIPNQRPKDKHCGKI